MPSKAVNAAANPATPWTLPNMNAEAYPGNHVHLQRHNPNAGPPAAVQPYQHYPAGKRGGGAWVDSATQVL